MIDLAVKLSDEGPRSWQITDGYCSPVISTTATILRNKVTEAGNGSASLKALKLQEESLPDMEKFLMTQIDN